MVTWPIQSSDERKAERTAWNQMIWLNESLKKYTLYTRSGTWWLI